MKTLLVLPLLTGLAALAATSCTTASNSGPLRTNDGVMIYSPPVGFTDTRPAAPC